MPKDEKHQDKKQSPAVAVVPQEAPGSQSAVAPPALMAGNVLAGGGAGEKQTREAYGGIDGILEKTGKDAKGTEARQGDPKALQAYGTHRKAVVNDMLRATMADQGLAGEPPAAGSTELSSDFDVTALGSQASDGASTFNNIFAQHFGDSKDAPEVAPGSSSPDEVGSTGGGTEHETAAPSAASAPAPRSASSKAGKELPNLKSALHDRKP